MSWFSIRIQFYKKKIDIFWKLRGNEKFHQVESTRDEIRNVNPIEKNNFM